MRVLIIVALTVILSGCTSTSHIKAVLNDIENTPRCDTENVYTSPQDTKMSLMGKVVVLNSRLDCMSDNYYINDRKLENYR